MADKSIGCAVFTFTIIRRIIMKNTLGDTIRSLRKRAKMTQEELADGICSPVSISRIENGVQMPSNAVLNALLDRLGTSTYQLCSIYYQTDKQLAFEEKANEADIMMRRGQIDAVKAMLPHLKSCADDNISRQACLLFEATIKLEEKDSPSFAADALDMLKSALALTRPDFNYGSFRDVLLTAQEANLLNAMLASYAYTEQYIQGIRLGEELHLALNKHQSSLGSYNFVRINTASLLAQLLGHEHRYEEAFAYCEEAQELSISSLEQVMLPEIEFIKATLYHDTGRDDECLAILRTIIPYMELIKKTSMLQTARSYAKEALGVEL